VTSKPPGAGPHAGWCGRTGAEYLFQPPPTRLVESIPKRGCGECDLREHFTEQATQDAWLSATGAAPESRQEPAREGTPPSQFFVEIPARTEGHPAVAKRRAPFSMYAKCTDNDPRKCKQSGQKLDEIVKIDKITEIVLN
jgi:hypothetical protein